MKRIITASFIFAFCINSFAQGYDAQWVLSFNTSTLDFRNDSVRLDTIAGNMPMFLTDADICDTNGNLLFFTNGCYVAGNNGNILQNGDSLNPCLYTDLTYSEGLGITQAAIFLPMPGSLRYYYLIHFSNDTTNNTRPGTVYYSLIDKDGNLDSGAVIKKNIPILQNVVLREGGMTACKHGNGRDYWVILLGSHNNEFYKFLLTPDSIIGPNTQDIGPAYDSAYDWAYSKFSLDGSKYVTTCVEGLILVMDFDRCSGEFSNPITFFHNASTIDSAPVSGATSVEFSPNDRFVYATNSIDLTQYDLWSDTIQDSTQIWNDNDSDFYKMEMLQLAPNGKLYGSTYNGGLLALHVINYPDLKGDSCNFVFGGQPTLSLNSDLLPNIINYNLGVLANSACDTIMAIGNGQLMTANMMKVMPNPADKYVYVEMGMQGNYEFDLMNTVGRMIDKKETRQVDIFDAENLSSGVYFLHVIDKSNSNNFLIQKVIVQH